MNDLISRQAEIDIAYPFDDNERNLIDALEELPSATIPAEELGIVMSEPRFTEAGDGTFTGYVTLDFRPNKNAKKLWGKIIGLPKFMVTEWCFPRKKKRGSRRRNRVIRQALKDAQPTADVRENVRGEWIYDAEAYPLGNPYGHYDCDQCGESVPNKTNFCPNCGADMRGGKTCADI